MYLILLGLPGSGKGTQASILSRHLGVPSISTGEVLRAEIASGSAIGMHAKSIIEAGKFVSDKIMIEILSTRLLNVAYNDGFILDGFPRTLGQAEEWDRSCAMRPTRKVSYIELNVSESTAISRLAGRIVCSICGRIYHRILAPPKNTGRCDVCGNDSIEERSDDMPSVIQTRLDVYKRLTLPVVMRYRSRGSLETIQAARAPHEVFADLQKIISA